jgi:hypothetical protein
LRFSRSSSSSSVLSSTTSIFFLIRLVFNSPPDTASPRQLRGLTVKSPKSQQERCRGLPQTGARCAEDKRALLRLRVGALAPRLVHLPVPLYPLRTPPAVLTHTLHPPRPARQWTAQFNPRTVTATDFQQLGTAALTPA